MQISKEFKFEAAHRLPCRTEKECQIYGKCSRLHGHSYRVVVYVEGDVDQYGWVINFDTVTEIAKELIEDRCDHMFLRFDENGDLSPTKDYVPMLDGELPSTAENMGQWWFGKIQERLQAVPGHNARISRIDVWETAKCRAIVTSPKNV